MVVLGATVIGFAILFFLVAFVQFMREAMRSSRKPRHLISVTRERPAARILTLREPPVMPKVISTAKKSDGVASASPLNPAIKRWPAKGSF